MKILAFVQGFSIKVANTKSLFFSNVHSRTRILYKSAHAGNHIIFVAFKLLILVQGFFIKVATAKTLFFSDVHSRTRILYKSAHAGNHAIFVVFKLLILVQGFSIKSAHVGHAYDYFRTDTNSEC